MPFKFKQPRGSAKNGESIPCWSNGLVKVYIFSCFLTLIFHCPVLLVTITCTDAALNLYHTRSPPSRRGANGLQEKLALQVNKTTAATTPTTTFFLRYELHPQKDTSTWKIYYPSPLTTSPPTTAPKSARVCAKSRACWRKSACRRGVMEAAAALAARTQCTKTATT